MVFTSFSFLVFVVCVFTVYHITSHKFQNIILLIASYVFYAYLDIRFLIYLGLVTALTYVISHLIINQSKYKKIILSIGILLIGSILFLLKYANLIQVLLQNIFLLINIQIQLTLFSWILPIGLSFYVFQSLSYLIDIYRDSKFFEKSLLNIALYLSYFPQITSGPISRAHKLMPQIKQKRLFNYALAEAGLYQFIWGAFKKLVIADQLSSFVNHVYSNYAGLDGVFIWMGVLAYSIQIYADFSGYSDMAIGISKVFGIDLGINFRNPYFATSIKDFWSRWHISLTSWFRDYVYIPLGGNRVHLARWIFNIIITFIISGLWHGANLTFVFWGFVHGVLQVIESQVTKINNFTFVESNFTTLIKRIWVFLLVSLVWIFFRADSITIAFDLMKHLIDFSLPTLEQILETLLYSVGYDKFTLFMVSISIGFMFWIEHQQVHTISVFYDLQNNRKKGSWIAIALIIWILIFGTTQASSFIYFNF